LGGLRNSDNPSRNAISCPSLESHFKHLTSHCTDSIATKKRPKPNSGSSPKPSDLGPPTNGVSMNRAKPASPSPMDQRTRRFSTSRMVSFNSTPSNLDSD